MTNEEFLTEMQDVLQTEEDLSMDTVLDGLDEWDSLSVMATMAFLEKSFGVKTTMKDYKDIKTIGDIAKKRDCKNDFFHVGTALYRNGSFFRIRRSCGFAS